MKLNLEVLPGFLARRLLRGLFARGFFLDARGMATQGDVLSRRIRTYFNGGVKFAGGADESPLRRAPRMFPQPLRKEPHD